MTVQPEVDKQSDSPDHLRRPGVQGRGSAITVGLGSLTAMRYKVAGSRCVPQSMQGVHRVIQSLFLFDVVANHVKQLPRSYHKCLLCLRNAVWILVLSSSKSAALYKSRHALLFRDIELAVFMIPPGFAADAGLRASETRL